MGVSQIVSVAVFVVAMALIMSEKMHRSLVAIVGAMLLLILHVLPFEAAMSHIDFNTLGVLFGMMLFVSVVKLSGLFEYLAVKCARVAKGDPWRIMILFVLLTAVLSAFLDNVTTVLLIGPYDHHGVQAARREPHSVLPHRDPRVQHRRHRHADRRPSQHHDRFSGGGSPSSTSSYTTRPWSSSSSRSSSASSISCSGAR